MRGNVSGDFLPVFFASGIVVKTSGTKYEVQLEKIIQPSSRCKKGSVAGCFPDGPCTLSQAGERELTDPESLDVV